MTTPTLELTETRDWNIGAVDLDAYLERIGHPLVAPAAEALRSLHEAHIRAIPFENLDVVLGKHPGLDLGVVADKLVHRRRGGYCYEHGLLFAAVLERLGYTVHRRMARVQPHRSGLRTHMTLAVHAEGTDYLTDVGFGAGMMYPMPLRDGAEVDQAGWPHRIVRQGNLWALTKRNGDEWEVLHVSDESPQRPVDYEVAHHYVSTHPRSPFTGQLVVMRLDHGVNRRLVGDELTVEWASGRTERTRVLPERLAGTLRDLDLEPEPEDLAGLRAHLS
ncbi:arylamine N-acetyltransferase family protein [Amycolatopsis cihanbeyliensis]|uniref:N-hydroxyarylamine O-acetyltransferase n=1 Tax=Amycolatopsis cihanbeyliensis TaxID=1128664 RepID=A0A542DNA9_AMYCI|nr:arylamine N-acetyltransferase [Amycolatopsis cihanbeyliensis]TQJ04589.1 N-hydroxyarylamine O-acetyltransferase [Amycolatopsis cihanbeyliensis]